MLSDPRPPQGQNDSDRSSTAPRIAFGRNAAGVMLGPDDVPRGKACALVCYACGAPLLARKGEVRRPHFAHWRSTGSSGCGMTAIHAMAQQLVVKGNRINLPEFVRKSSKLNGEEFIQQATTLTYDSAAPEVRVSSFRADVKIYSHELNAEIYCEIIVSHEDSAAKSEFYKRSGAVVLAIDLSHLRNATPSVEELEFEIFNGHNTRRINDPLLDAEFHAWERSRLASQKRLPIRVAKVLKREGRLGSSHCRYTLGEFTHTNANPSHLHSQQVLHLTADALLTVHPTAPGTWLPIEKVYERHCITRNTKRQIIDIRVSGLKDPPELPEATQRSAVSNSAINSQSVAKPERNQPSRWSYPTKSSTEGLQRRAPRDENGNIIFRDEKGRRW